MRLIADYMPDSEKRRALNRLTRDVFGFDFESWVCGGFWEGDYIPYSLEENGRVFANVSVNRMNFLECGEARRYVQLGTVMTDISMRGRGLARRLMERVIADWLPVSDGLYLFADLDAVGFYEKFGFRVCGEYRYRLRKDAGIIRSGARWRSARGLEKEYRACVRSSVPTSALFQSNGYSLCMFYTSCMEDVFVLPGGDTFIVCEAGGGVLTLKGMYTSAGASLAAVLAHADEEYSDVLLGFTPLEADARLFERERYDGGEDYRLMVLGPKPAQVEEKRLIFPMLSHA